MSGLDLNPNPRTSGPESILFAATKVEHEPHGREREGGGFVKHKEARIDRVRVG